MVRIVLGGDGLDTFEPAPFSDQYVNVVFPPPEASPADQRPIGRRYTIRNWDADTRQLTIDFVVHGDVGTAGRWANSAQVGDLLEVVGPGGGYAPDPEADWHLLVGDESATPAIAASLERLESGARALVVLLVDDSDSHQSLPSAANVDTHWVYRAADPANANILAAVVASLTFPDGRVHAFVHGEASETRAVRTHLLGDRGIEKANTSISPYWRRDHTDEQWRKVKEAWNAEVATDV